MRSRSGFRIVLYANIGLLVLEALAFARFRVAHDSYARIFLILLVVTFVSSAGILGAWRLSASGRR